MSRYFAVGSASVVTVQTSEVEALLLPCEVCLPMYLPNLQVH